MNPNDKNRTIIHQLRAWLNGDLRRKEEAELFEAAGKDPFLQETLQGYQRFPEGSHQKRLDSIKNKLNQGGRKRMILPIRIAVAAASIFLVASSIFFLIRSEDQGIAQSIESPDQSTAQEAISPPSADEALEAPQKEIAETQEAPEKKSPTKKEATKQEPSQNKPEPVIAERQEKELLADEMVEEEAIVEVSPTRELVLPPPSNPAGGTTGVSVEREYDIALRQQDLPKEKKKREEINVSPYSYQVDSRSAQNVQPLLADSLMTRHRVFPAIAQPVGGFEKMEIHLDSTVKFERDTLGFIFSGADFFEAEFQLKPDGSLTNISATSGSSGTGGELDSFFKALKTGPKWELLDPVEEKEVRIRYRYFPLKKK